jgi:hypothetical protein
MSNRFIFDGLEEFKTALRALPAELTAEGEQIVRDHAYAAKDAIHEAYPEVTGNLKKGLVVTRLAGESRWGVAYEVRNKAKHARIYERGTQARHYYTAERGVKHATGAMPPGNKFLPNIIRYRRLMRDALRAMLVRHFLVVTEDAADAA